MHDPLFLDIRHQVRVLLSHPDSLQHISTTYRHVLTSDSTTTEMLDVLSQLLAHPSLTYIVSELFSPLLMDLCSRWMDKEDDGREEDYFIALANLLSFHPELHWIVAFYLQQPRFRDGPLGLISSPPDQSLPPYRLHFLLIAYYRILSCSLGLLHRLSWPLKPLRELFFHSRHPDAGVRYLACRCYAIQARLSEKNMNRIVEAALGPLYRAQFQISYGTNRDGELDVVDGWSFPMLELHRASDNASNPKDELVWSTERTIEPHHLSPRIVNIHNILLFRQATQSNAIPNVVPTSPTIDSLRRLALHLSAGLPSLITSTPSSGKSLMIQYLSSMLYPAAQGHVLSVYLGDTSFDPRSLIGCHVSSESNPGQFEWRDGVLVQSMIEGKWLVLEDIDRASAEVLGIILPLLESMSLPEREYGSPAIIDVPHRGQISSRPSFAVFATRSISPSSNGEFSPPSFLGSQKFREVALSPPNQEELFLILSSKYPVLPRVIIRSFIELWTNLQSLPNFNTAHRSYGLRDLDKLCRRVGEIVDSGRPQTTLITPENSTFSSLLPHPSLREEILIEIRDVFFGSEAFLQASDEHSVLNVLAELLGLTTETCLYVLSRVPPIELIRNDTGRIDKIQIGRTRLAVQSPVETSLSTRGFAMHQPAQRILSRLATCVRFNEPVLLVGETGTGKTSIVSHFASILNRPVVALNLSLQTQSSDLIGGFRPINARISAAELQRKFTALFDATFSRSKNAKFGVALAQTLRDGKWKKTVMLWQEACELAKQKLAAHPLLSSNEEELAHEMSRKRRKLRHSHRLDDWLEFEKLVSHFEHHHVRHKSKFAFAFTEGPLVRAVRDGTWILLDEINLASSETLDCVSSLVQTATSSITLTEAGHIEPVPRHPDFRLFACMNPATDVGKKELAPNVKSRFTEIFVESPDKHVDTLIAIVKNYIGPYAVSDTSAILDVAEFYMSVRQLASRREIAHGNNQKPHYSMRTLTRALNFACQTSVSFGLRRALWEGCILSFMMCLDAESFVRVRTLAEKHLLSGVTSIKAFLQKPMLRSNMDGLISVNSLWLKRGPLNPEPCHDYIITPSVETKITGLARAILFSRSPVMIEGPTSSGKTSSIEYLARLTGHRFVRINNHEHTDIQEYLGSYVSDPLSGKLVFTDGILVRALRRGDWLVLDELNLAPTEVLEALNRLLDDNRELWIPETQEMVKAHPDFLLFATQNPADLYAGRKVLSRAFRNRFLEFFFDEVPQKELETILCEHSQIAPSFAARIVTVFQELQRRRQSSRIFESKHSFATLRDLFRWAGRGAGDVQSLAEDGFMLLAERARRDDDKQIVKEVLESTMRVHIDADTLYDFAKGRTPSFPTPSYDVQDGLVWTSAMRRLYFLVMSALMQNEPVLLVGETGCGKTSICSKVATVMGKRLCSVNCHQNTETADLIGGERPIRNRSGQLSELHAELCSLIQSYSKDPADALSQLDTLNDPVKIISFIVRLRGEFVDPPAQSALEAILSRCHRLQRMFEWHDGPLVQAMHNGDIFMLDEISLADDSVLERLNSVLEPGRLLVLAEKPVHEQQDVEIRPVDGFHFLATMNPGGDYGKKELSPALRNRFTEIWVPNVSLGEDLKDIVQHSWGDPQLQPYTSPLLSFLHWLARELSDWSFITIRDVMAWVKFSTQCRATFSSSELSNDAIFHHAARLIFLDGLDFLPRASTLSHDGIQTLRIRCIEALFDLVPCSSKNLETPELVEQTERHFKIGPFALARVHHTSSNADFDFRAPTTRANAMRLVRACQMNRPILLEGSPGVGKTTLIVAVAAAAGRHLCRINLSEQTDLVDLFGADLPAEGGRAGEFLWRDAEFLQALQNGSWVLLDEMNLASQTVLEGLNPILDHRGSVYIPELDRTFHCHPDFRVFAAQNPTNQGGGRKGLPKSFVNRFTKVYMQELQSEDLTVVLQNRFPDISQKDTDLMIKYNQTIAKQVNIARVWGQRGTPWEFNLRDLMRWARLLVAYSGNQLYRNPVEHIQDVYLHRFRSREDRRSAFEVYQNICMERVTLPAPSWPTVSPNVVSFGRSSAYRGDLHNGERPVLLSPYHFQIMESISHCLDMNWLLILVGDVSSGKTHAIQALAHLRGRRLHTLSMHAAVDTTDLLGGYEQHDRRSAAIEILHSVIDLHDRSLRQAAVDFHPIEMSEVRKAISDPSATAEQLFGLAQDALSKLELSGYLAEDREVLLKLLSSQADADEGRFVWKDGPLVEALRNGHWFVLDNANLCPAAVLDRLNSLCETAGTLVLSERGPVEGHVQVIRPHNDFRIFMTVDPGRGELSRAMRNRGVEIFLDSRLSERHEGISRKSQQWLLSRGIGMPYRSTPIYSPWLQGQDSMAELAALSRSILDVFAQKDLLGHDAAIVVWVAQTVPLEILEHMNHFAAFILSALPVTLRRLILSFCGEVCRDTSSKVLELRDLLAKQYNLPGETLKWQSLTLSVVQTFVPSLTDSCSDLDDLSRGVQLMAEIICAVHAAESSDVSMDGGAAYMSIRDTIAEVLAATLEECRAIVSVGLKGLWERSLLILRACVWLSKGLESAELNWARLRESSQWLATNLLGMEGAFPRVTAYAIELRESFLLKSGVEIVEIWQYWFGHRPSIIAEIDQQMLRIAVPGNELSLLRSRAHDVMREILHSDTPRGIDKSVILQKELANYELRGSDSAVEDTWYLLNVELHILSSISTNSVAIYPDFVRVVYRHPDARLSVLLSYDAMFDKNGTSFESHPYRTLEAYIQWHRLLWECGSNSDPVPSRPQSLMGANLTLTALRIFDLSSRTLNDLSSYDSLLGRQAEFLSMEIRSNQPDKATMLVTMLGDCLLLLLGCFTTGEPGQQRFSVPADLPQDPLQRLLCLISVSMASKNHELSLNVSDSFLASLGQSSHRNNIEPFEIGQCWIALAQIILKLYVPDKPIDPAEALLSNIQRRRAEEALLSTQLNMLKETEYHVAGSQTGRLATRTDADLQQTRKELITLIPPPTRRSTRDLGTLKNFFVEVDQFMSQVASQSKVSAIIADSRAPIRSTLAEEQLIQDSMTNFMNRMVTNYPSFDDLFRPIEFGLRLLKFGLRLVSGTGLQSPSENNVSPLIKACVQSPSILGTSCLSSVATHLFSSSASTPDVLLLYTAGIAFRYQTGVPLLSMAKELQATYDALSKIWHAARTEDQIKTKQLESLYRFHQDVPDVAEEIEFRALFPTFDEPDVTTDATEGIRGIECTSQSAGIRIAPRVTETLWRLHVGMMSNGGQGLGDQGRRIWNHIRVEVLQENFLAAYGSQSHTLDRHSLALRLQLHCLRRDSLDDTPKRTGVPYDFYQDMNVSEVSKMMATVNTLDAHVVQLLELWPEQMALQEIQDQCRLLSRVAMSAPIPRVLAYLERILLRIDDWERFSKRDTSLTSHQSKIKEAIIGWRRLELACWANILDIEFHKFSSKVSEWWFMLYETLIQGTSSIPLEDGQALDSHLTQLVPLLDSFMSSCSLGHFNSRLELLQSFIGYLNLLCDHNRKHPISALLRVRMIVRTMHAQYKRYIDHVGDALARQRTAIEKEIQDFIKLASWKDANVQALKESAQHTHRKLHRCIIKFRHVLSQPVLPFLSLPTSYESESRVQSKSPLLTHHDLVVDQDNSNQTLRSVAWMKFADIISTKIIPCLRAAQKVGVVEDLCATIINTSQSFSDVQLGTKTAAEQRDQKALLRHKRKAWIDLLKELRRIGLSPYTKSDVAAKLRSRLWLMEQPSVPFDVESEVSFGDRYYQQSLKNISHLSILLSDHHADLTTPELQKAISFIENLTFMAFELRSSLLKSWSEYSLLQKICHRLSLVPAAEAIFRVGEHADHVLDKFCTVFAHLSESLFEIIQTIELYHSLLVDAGPIPPHILSCIKSVAEESKSIAGNITRIRSEATGTHTTVLLEAEIKVLEGAIKFIQRTAQEMDGWMAACTVLRSICASTAEWIAQLDLTITSNDLDPEVTNLESSVIGPNIFLLTCQQVLGVTDGSVMKALADQESPDGYLIHYQQSVSRLGQLSNLTRVNEHMVNMLSKLRTPLTLRSSVWESLARSLPYLRSYLIMCHAQLTEGLTWVRTILKLAHIIYSLVRTLATKGFCKPTENETDGARDPAESQPEGGTGFGEGIGETRIAEEEVDEAQVEGLQAKTDDEEPQKKGEDDDDAAFEMDLDPGGALEDVDEAGDGSEDEDEDDATEHEDTLEDLDPNDPNVLDEKLWGTDGPQDEAEQNAGQSKESKSGTNTAAKETDSHGDHDMDKEDENVDAPMEDDEGAADETSQGAEQMTEHLPDSDVLELPDNLELSADDKLDLPVEDEDDPMDDDPFEEPHDSTVEPEADHTSDDPAVQDAEASTSHAAVDDTSSNVEQLEANQLGEGGGTGGAKDKLSSNNTPADGHDVDQDNNSAMNMPSEITSQPELGTKHSDVGGSSNDVKMATLEAQHDSHALSENTDESSRIKGDPARAASKRDVGGGTPLEKWNDQSELGQTDLQYIQDPDDDVEMQALGPSSLEEASKLKELNVADPGVDSEAITSPLTAPEIEAQPPSLPNHIPPSRPQRSDEIGHDPHALVFHNPKLTDSSPSTNVHVAQEHPTSAPALIDSTMVENALKSWQLQGQPASGSEILWHQYESLTHDLSYLLCEQLRLILEPTKATRFKGDYQSGKRLNMRKIIPYIASEFTKDKIWMRRTRPSQREYQVILALDDSKSMSESHCTHLAYQTLVLVSTALNRLEVGSVAVARFGQSVDILHEFASGPLDQRSGGQVLNTFKFDQGMTDVYGLLQRSLEVFQDAREEHGSDSSRQLWQLEIVISDGICQSHDRLRTLLRLAEERRVLVVFIILDALRSQTGTDLQSQDSILSMEQVSYSTVDGRAELQLRRYLDTFPFSYYVVLNDVDALPDVLSDTLRQFFERSTE
ncbi:hypothetical protein SISSUDRAFT_1125502 [Sistotremastrum suecicum HHB10207 ss-3]|uniref:Midasin n=1 Tax=Sistotremastrum suecicum HHB10207 ss-3 TaxID=1314776 RepID=A0A166HEW9_9AGAM|nr:hypothetical protein SISSUDRAFT_1125502 [Sistotremastrum suecicum HHB10207 ss-3]